MRDRLHSNMMRAAAFGTARMLQRGARAVGWSPVSLDPDNIEAAARRAVRLDDFGDAYYREGLRRFVESAERDGDVHLIGRVYLRQIIRTALINRLLLQRHRQTHPEIFEAPLRPPIIITGLPRTGTTLLHGLMSRIPGFFAPPYWLLVRPLPVGAEEPEDVRRDAARREMRWWKVITPSIRAKHRLAITRPEECMFALQLTFQTTLFGSVVPAESYLAWYAASDRRKKYLDYRAILMTLQAAHPDQTLLLKAPDHLGGLDALCAAVPEARVVQCHRDPVVVLNSLASLVYSSQFGLSERRDPARLAASLAGYLETTLKRNLAQRPHLPVPVLDVHYRELTADPVATAARILRTFNVAMPKGGRAAMSRYMAADSKSRRGRHQYSSAEFHLDDARIAERFKFYSASFAVDA